MTFHIQTTAMAPLHSARFPYVYRVCFSFPVFGPLPVALGQGFPASFHVTGSFLISNANLGDSPTPLSDSSPA